jgi:argininosuccinate lyase
MLGKQGIITGVEAEEIVAGLKEVLADIESGKVDFTVQDEDIHMNVERLLTEKIGPVGKKLHTARSRNDQVALDVRIYLKDEIIEVNDLLKELIKVLVAVAKDNLDTYMPGYTHLQKAQPITLAHHLLAYCQMFHRDMGRFKDCFNRVDVLPLGSGALAGTTFPIDRELVAKELGFAAVSDNSLDAVSDRDFAIEFLGAASILMMHLSRFCEELIIWSTDEFKFVEMDDAYSTGSSIMPQKKNPDVAELIRGKTGRVYGSLMTLLTVMKSLPLAYNKDMQEDKEPLFDGIDTVKKSLLVFTPMVNTMSINKAAMAQGAKGGFTNATDVADYLAKKGVSFREAHEIVGKMVFYCLEHQKNLEGLTLDEYQQHSQLFDEDIFGAISLETCVNQRRVIGGPAKEAVLAAIAKLEQQL